MCLNFRGGRVEFKPVVVVRPTNQQIQRRYVLMKMIDAQQLTKRFGNHTAVSELTFSVDKGEILGFLGPNGAGKTTTLRMIAGFLPITEGKIAVDGVDVVEDSVKARSRIGYMPESVPLYPELRVDEYLRFRAELKGIASSSARKKAVDRAMELSHITDRARWLIGELSKGYKQRVGLADALVSSPPVLILDEPTASLDPNQIAEVRELIKSLGKEHTIVLSTHILPEVEAVCSRVLIMSRGKIVADGTVEQIGAKLKGSGTHASVVVRGSRKAILKALESVEGANLLTESSELSDDVAINELLINVTNAEESIESVVKSLVQNEVALRSLTVEQQSLEEVFRQLTTVDSSKEEQADAKESAT